MKSQLVAGKKYCVKFYVNISDPSTYSIDGFGAYFGDNTIDTITKCMVPLTYLIPQVQNAPGNLISDTMNWIPITGTFVANGNEKFCIIGNFKSDAGTGNQLINSTSSAIFCDVLIDDVSCIPLDLPAYASPGPDIWAIPGNTVYLGRPQDVGIDEACMWYKLPNTTNAIDTAAGITVTVAVTTETYMVKQDICGVIKYDTVVVHASALGFVSSSAVENDFGIFPNPAKDYFELCIANSALAKNLNRIYIFDSLGQLIREENLSFDNNKATVNTSTVPAGVYFVTLENENGFLSHTKLVVSK